MSTLEMQPGETGSLSARIYGKLREGLIVGNFTPGERFLMHDLAERLGTSITPVREACLRLVSEQALELRSGRFVSVPELSLDRYLQITLIRGALEALATEEAVGKVHDADIDRLEEFHSAFVEREKAGDFGATRHWNRQFHFGVYRLSGMPMLVAQIENLWVSMGPILNIYYREVHHDYTGAEEHVKLLDALRERNRKAAGQALRDDILRAGVSLRKHLAGLEIGRPN